MADTIAKAIALFAKYQAYGAYLAIFAAGVVIGRII